MTVERGAVSPVVGRTQYALHASSPGSRHGLGEYYSRCKNLALYIRDCESLCLSDETVKVVGPFYLVSMPGEVKDPTQGVNV